MDTNSSQNYFLSTELLAIVEDLHSGDLSKIDNAAARLKQLESAPLLDTISNALNDSNPHSRCLGIELLCVVGTEQHLEIVLPLLEDPIDFVRSNLLDCLLDCKLADSRIVEPLMNVLLNDPDSNVRSLAAVILGNLRDTRAKSALQWAAEHDVGTDYEGVAISKIAQRALEDIE